VLYINYLAQLTSAPADLNEFESLKTTDDCALETTLFVEQQKPTSVLFLLAGQVKLSMNPSAGRG